VSTLPRPSASGSYALEQLTTSRLHRTGAAWDEVARWEASVRERWSALAAAEPTPGTRRALARLAGEARRLVESHGSVLAHAVRTAPMPWDPGEEPLRGLGERAGRFLAASTALLALLERQHEAARRLRALQAEWHPRFPRAWARETARHGVSVDAVGRAPDAGTLAAVEERMERVHAALRRWGGEVDEWLRRMGAEGEPGTEGDAASPEERYEALLSIGQVDRHALQLRTAALLRAAVGRHLDALEPRDDPARRAWAVRMARAWNGWGREEPVGAEEAAAYREALRVLHLRPARPPRPEGDA
jgi:hypothetical protein